MADDKHADGNHAGHLGAVYAAKTSAEIALHYDNWAQGYDAWMSSVGYQHPTLCLALIARYLPRGAAPLLDAGVGTGLIGEWLSLLGYPVLEGLDVSQGMLDVAAQRGVYAKLHKLALGGPLPLASDSFAGIVSAGVFTSGHVGVEGLDELLRITRPGGIIIMTVKSTLMAEAMDAHLRALEASGQISLLETTMPYVSMPGEQGTVPSCALALCVNRSG